MKRQTMWAERAENGLPDKGVTMAQAATFCAMPTAAVAIATACATPALSAED